MHRMAGPDHIQKLLVSHPNFDLQHIQASAVAFLEQHIQNLRSLRLWVVDKQPRRRPRGQHA